MKKITIALAFMAIVIVSCDSNGNTGNGANDAPAQENSNQQINTNDNTSDNITDTTSHHTSDSARGNR